MQYYWPLLVVVLVAALIVIPVMASRKNTRVIKTLIPSLLQNNNIIYYPYINPLYLNDKMVKKPDGKVLIKRLPSDGTLPFIAVGETAVIGARPLWVGKSSFVGNLYYYTNQVETLEIGAPFGKEYVLLFSDIKNNPPSDNCIYKVIAEEDKFTAAMLLVPVDEYKDKYYVTKFGQ